MESSSPIDGAIQWSAVIVFELRRKKILKKQIILLSNGDSMYVGDEAYRRTRN